VSARQPERRAVPRRKKSHRSFYAAVVLIAVAGVAALAYLLGRPQPASVSTYDPTLPAGEAKGYTLGRTDAPVQMIEFADFECPACAHFAVVTEPDVRKRLVDPGLLRVTFYDDPLPMHKNTWFASHAAACANDQGKFWEMHDRIFAGQNDWNGETTDNPVPLLEGYAKALGLDVPKWRACVNGRVHQRDIEANRAEAERRHVQQTPTFVIGKRMIAGSISYDEIKAYLDTARAGAAAKPSAAP
jgi:protein-disulfide isomerase